MAVTQTYQELCQILGNLYPELDGCSFYRFIFPNNEEQGKQRSDYSRPNAVYLYRDQNDQGTERRMRRRIMLSDTWDEDYSNFIEMNSLTLCSGLTYRNRFNRLQNAQRMNALVFDLDGVREQEIRNLFLRFGAPADRVRSLPMPTFLVTSGAGLHVYYVFDQPVDLYPNIKLQLKALKYDLVFRMWEYKATSTRENIQYQSINQTFRMVGSVNEKYGNVLRAFQTGDRVTLEYINQYVKPENRVDVNKPFKPSKMTRAQAKEAYPEWYQRVVVEKRRRLKKWDIKGKQGFALYEWWLRQIGEIKGGHRYYFLMCLVIYACKCDVPREKLEADMQAAYEQLRLIQHDNALTKEDIRSALETYDKEYYNFTIADIEKLTDVRIKRNKRNGRKQMEHLQAEYWQSEKGRPAVNVCKQNRELALQFMREQGTISGRPRKEEAVKAYVRDNPKASVTQIAKALSISRPTIYKYLVMEINDNE